jgi:hypothetical protein
MLRRHRFGPKPIWFECTSIGMRLRLIIRLPFAGLRSYSVDVIDEAGESLLHVLVASRLPMSSLPMSM